MSNSKSYVTLCTPINEPVFGLDISLGLMFFYLFYYTKLSVLTEFGLEISLVAVAISKRVPAFASDPYRLDRSFLLAPIDRLHVFLFVLLQTSSRTDLTTYNLHSRLLSCSRSRPDIVCCYCPSKFVMMSSALSRPVAPIQRGLSPRRAICLKYCLIATS